MIDLNLARYKAQLQAFNEHLLTVDIPKNLVDGDGIEAVSFTPYDIKTLSDDNDVVHFRIEEAPGWLFGIWYNIDLREHHDVGVIVDLHCSFFAQYERLIDKFKPSRSTLCVHEKVYNFRGVHKDFEAGFCDVADLIKFIITEPELAFCRDVHGWDYNYVYHTREEAKEEMNRILGECAKQEQFEDYAQTSVFAFMMNTLKGEDGYVRDWGTNVSPRYEVTLFTEGEEGGEHIKTIIDEYEKDNSYCYVGLYDFCKQLVALYKELEEEACKLHYFWWINPGSNWVHWTTREHFESWKNEVGPEIENRIHLF